MCYGWWSIKILSRSGFRIAIEMKFKLEFSYWLVIASSLVIGTACTELGQENEPALVKPIDPQTAISKLDFLTGNWAGPGISYGVDGTEKRYHDTEFVRFDLDKHLLLINARGEDASGETTYSLHTVIHYNAETQKYIYTPYSGTRQPRSFDCTLNDRAQFICLIPDQSYRLTFQRLPDGRWNEFGERLKDGEWVKNFETILSAQ